jgi:PAS domain S-box-containing protein
VAIIRDVTARKQVEAARRLSEEKFAKAFDANPAAMALSRLADGQFLEVNDTWVAMTGYRREEAIGRTALELGIWPDPAARTRFAQQLRRTERLRGWEETFVKKSGERFISLVSSEVITVQGEAAVLSTLLDITERKQAEQALRESVERVDQALRLFDGVASTTPDFVYVFDRAGRFQYANRRLLEVWGMTRPEVIGKTCRDLGYEQWHHDMHMREIAQVIATKRPIKGEVPFKAPRTGIFGVYEYIFTPVLGRDGEVEIIAGTTRDVTERKEAEEKLQGALSEKDAALATNQTLLREVHHRVKNNLQMLCDMLYLQMEGMGDAEKAEVLRDTYGRIYAIARLHEQLYRAMQSGEIHLGSYITRLVVGFETLHPGVPVKMELGDDEVRLDVDRAIHLALIVNELVTNAVKHAFADGAPGEVAVRLHRIGETVEIQVRDTGKGLPPDLDLEQAKSLGLRIVRILARRLGATVRIENDRGAAFTLAFALHAEAPLEPRQD